MIDARADGLTAREAELMELVARGHTNKEMAERLFVSPNTVKAHLKKAFRKCGVRNRVEAASWWSRRAAEAPATVPLAEPVAARTPVRWRSPRLGILLAGATVPAALVLAAGFGGLAFVGGSAGAPEQHCVAEATVVTPATGRDALARPEARCFDTLAEALSFATDGAASSIEELPPGTK